MSIDWRVEDPSDSCRAIIEFIQAYDQEGQKHATIRRALLEDLCFKSQSLSTAERNYILAKGMYYTLPARLKRLYSIEDLKLTHFNLNEERLHKNVGIVLSARLDLGTFSSFFPVRALPGTSHNNQHFLSELTSSEGETISIIVSAPQRTEAIVSALAVNAILRFAAPDLILLLGVANSADHTDGDIFISEGIKEIGKTGSEIKGNGSIEGELLQERNTRKTKIDLTRLTNLLLQDRFEIYTMHKQLDDLKLIRYESQQQSEGRTGKGERRKQIRLSGASTGDAQSSEEDRVFGEACSLFGVPWLIFRTPVNALDALEGPSILTSLAAHTLLTDCLLID